MNAGDDVLVPGEQEDRYRVERLKTGIPLPDDTWASLLAVAREVGIDGTRLQKIQLL
jgi:hydroxycarboxylate dehydrogenase B